MDATVAALTSTGRPDRSFSGDGAFTFDYIWEYESGISALTISGDRLYAVGAAAWPQMQPLEGGVAAIRLR